LLTKGSAGVRLGAYEALRLLGRGGMASVYEATDGRSGRRVALKVMDASLARDSVASRRFLREADLIARVRHSHVIRVFDLGIQNDVPFIVMELLHGETLAQHLSTRGRMSVAPLVESFAAICSAVAAIHEAGIVHRDLKASNVMLTHHAGSRTHPMVLDFGISKVRRATGDASLLTHSRALLGTVRYLSPEQTLNPRAAGPLSDQYALGVMLYEAATGKSPFVAGSTYQLMHAIVNGSFLPPSAQVTDLPPALDELILTAMHRDVSRRFSSVAALQGALLACARAQPVRVSSRDCNEPRCDVLDVTEHDGSVRAILLEARAPLMSNARRATQRPSRRLLFSAALCAITLGAIVWGDLRYRGTRAAARHTAERVSAARIPLAAASSLRSVARPAAAVTDDEGPAAALPAANTPAVEAPPSQRRKPIKNKRTRAASTVKGSSKGVAPGKDEAIDPFALVE